MKIQSTLVAVLLIGLFGVSSDAQEGIIVSADTPRIMLPELPTDPNNIANQGVLYTKDVSGITELFYLDSGGATDQLTSAGSESLVEADIDTSSELATIVTNETGTGVLTFATAPTFTTSISVGSAGVSIADDGDGAITFLSLGNGSGGLENLILNLDDTSNVGTFTSSTSLATLNFSSIALQESGIAVLNNDEIDASSELSTIMDDETGEGLLVFATSSALVTPSLGSATATSITLGSGSPLSNYGEGTFTPAVTLVGGSGNVIPAYSTTTGRYTQIGDRVFADIYLTGDGGDEGAGTGALTLSIPFAASSSIPAQSFVCGTILMSDANGGSPAVTCTIATGATVTTLSLLKPNFIGSLTTKTTLTGDMQGNTDRHIRLNFSYEL